MTPSMPARYASAMAGVAKVEITEGTMSRACPAQAVTIAANPRRPERPVAR